MDRDKERKAAKAFGMGASIYGIVFMVIWCGIAAASGGWFMLIFGIPMLGFMIYRTVVMAKMSRKPKEKDPWEQPDRQYSYTQPQGQTAQNGFCPYCGRESQSDYVFCPKCGRRLG